MKKIFGLLLIIAAAWFVWAWLRPGPIQSNFGVGDVSFNASLIGTKSSNVLSFASFSTTTPTSTKDVAIGNSADIADLNLCVIASSTSSVVNWYYEFSNDGTNWYGQDASSITSNVVTHESATTTHSWTVPSTALTCKNVQIENLNSNWIRFVFYRISSVAGATNFYLNAEGAFTDKN